MITFYCGPTIFPKFYLILAHVENEENVVQWNGGEQIQEEPGSNIMLGDEFGIDDNLFTIILLHDS